MSSTRSKRKQGHPEEVAAEVAAAAVETAVAADSPKRLKTDIDHTSYAAPGETTDDPVANQFNHYLFKIIAFKAARGNFQVPRDVYPDLHQWLQTLKREYKNYSMDPASSLLTQEQLKVLEFLHIPVTSRGDDHWNRFYELLRQYAERHGHVLVPRLCEVPGLGDWVTDQRRQYKAWKQGQSTQLTQERRDKLEAIGFAWSVRNRPEWEQRYHELLQYKEKHGDCKVPQHYKLNKSLGKWVAKQREQYKLYCKGQHSFLTPYRLEKLKEVGFVWQVRSSGMAEHEDDMNPLDVKMEQHQAQIQQPMEMAAAAAAQVAAAAMQESVVDTRALRPPQDVVDDMANV